ncbi:response regulator transcription factor [Oryzibacter oryziterrae]|uniref:response regulator transcription factor n=1 Tax=Oryzibacter oryziterrae TaxID=2766474 RepID=UPI001F458065|nr:response regulator transcription factor [Oryzibacter oryziterrae]
MSDKSDEASPLEIGRTWTAIVAEDHPIIQSAVVRMLKKRFGFKQPILATTYDELADAVMETGENTLVITDLVMPGMRGLDTIKRMRALAPKAWVAVYSSNSGEELAQGCLELGCRAFIGKRSSEDAFAAAIETVLDGGTIIEVGADPTAISQAVLERSALVSALSPQQLKVFQLLGDGLLNKQIAYQLGISEATVKAHVGKILETLKITSRSQAAITSAWMVEHGLI